MSEGARNVITYHGPIDAQLREGDVRVVTFTGAEEADLLHAAGTWMSEHLEAVLIGMNWVADYLCPHDLDHPTPPRRRLDLTVDLSLERH